MMGGAGPSQMDPSKLKEQIDHLTNMDDTQMDYMVNMMKQNPAMMKANYEA